MRPLHHKLVKRMHLFCWTQIELSLENYVRSFSDKFILSIYFSYIILHGVNVLAGASQLCNTLYHQWTRVAPWQHQRTNQQWGVVCCVPTLVLVNTLISLIWKFIKLAASLPCIVFMTNACKSIPCGFHPLVHCQNKIKKLGSWHSMWLSIFVLKYAGCHCIKKK
jgi:hypothetical protein